MTGSNPNYLFLGYQKHMHMCMLSQDREMLKKVIISGDWVEYQKGK